MRSLLVLDTPARWTRLADLLARLGDVTTATTSVPTSSAASTLATVQLPSDASEWRSIVADHDAIVHVGPASRLATLVEALSSTGVQSRVVVAAAATAAEAPATEAVAERVTGAGLRVCCARLGAWIDEDCGVRALLPLYRCFVGLRERADDRPMWWCHAYDVARAIVFAIQSEDMSGYLRHRHARAQRGFATSTERSVRRSTNARVADHLATASRMVGERLAQELRLGAERTPERLSRTGFAFVFPDIRSAVADVLR